MAGLKDREVATRALRTAYLWSRLGPRAEGKEATSLPV